MARGIKRIKKGFRLTEEAERLLEKLAQHLGISQTSVLEQAIRDLARREGISG